MTAMVTGGGNGKKGKLLVFAPYLVNTRLFTTVHGINTTVYDGKCADCDLPFSPYISVHGHGNIRA